MYINLSIYIIKLYCARDRYLRGKEKSQFVQPAHATGLLVGYTGFLRHRPDYLLGCVIGLIPISDIKPLVECHAHLLVNVEKLVLIHDGSLAVP